MKQDRTISWIRLSTGFPVNLIVRFPVLNLDLRTSLGTFKLGFPCKPDSVTPTVMDIMLDNMDGLSQFQRIVFEKKYGRTVTEKC